MELEEIMSKMSPRCQELARMRMKGMKWSEMSKVTEVTPGRLQQLYRTARMKAFREWMKINMPEVRG